MGRVEIGAVRIRDRASSRVTPMVVDHERLAHGHDLRLFLRFDIGDVGSTSERAVCYV